jgi:multiple sugar transport system substrate-binding protein
VRNGQHVAVARRAWLRGATGVVAGGALAACAGPGATPAVDQAAPAAVRGGVTWMVRSNQLENDWQQNVVAPRLKHLHPGIDVALDVTADATWADRTFALDAAGTPAEVMSGYRGTFITLYAQQKVLELTPLIKRDRVDLKPFGGFERDADMCRSGKQWGLPVLTTHGIMTFYNIALLEQAGVRLPPTSWDDRSWTLERLVDAARRTTRNWGQPNAVYGYLPFGQFHPWAYLWKGDPWTPEFYRQGIAQTSTWTAPVV